MVKYSLGNIPAGKCKKDSQYLGAYFCKWLFTHWESQLCLRSLYKSSDIAINK